MKKIKNLLQNLFIVTIITLLIALECFSYARVIKASYYVGALNGKEYDDFEDLVDDLEDYYEGKTVTIDMYCKRRNYNYS